MTRHTTNYTDTFIAVAEDCHVKRSEIPDHKTEEPSSAALPHHPVRENPCRYTSEVVLLNLQALRNGIPRHEWKEVSEVCFCKGKAHLRASPLTTRSRSPVHYEAHGRMALAQMDPKEYRNFSTDLILKQVKAMRTERA